MGWTPSPVDMGGDAVAGICPARGTNAALPARWRIYLVVSRLDDSMAKCVGLGGRVLVAPKSMGPHARVGVIQDPAGTVAALFEPA